MSTTAYTLMGNLPVVPAAELISLTSNINVRGSARLGDAGAGKTAGMVVIRDSGTGDRYSMVFATGGAAADVWLAVDGATKYTPI